MLSPLLRGAFSKRAVFNSSRFLSSRTSSAHVHHAPSRRLRWYIAGGAVLGSSAFLAQSTVFADAPDVPLHDSSDSLQSQRKPVPLLTLARAYVVYAACSFPALVDYSPTILSTLMSVPVIRQITEAVVRVTFFDQFVGGDTAEGTLPVLEALREENKGCIFAYSVEVDENEAAGGTKAHAKLPVHKRIVKEMIHSIDVAADFEEKHRKSDDMNGRATYVAVKMTALLPNAESLIKFSKYLVNTRPNAKSIAFPGAPHPTDLEVLNNAPAGNSTLTEQDIIDLKDLYSDLTQICTRAQERGVRILMDAEHTWYQPAIDAFTLAMMRRFNKISDDTSPVQPLIYATFQAYLRRTPEYLFQSFADAKAGGYALGVKLVRGAYHPHEMKAHVSALDESKKHGSLSISPEAYPPVWTAKSESDDCYNHSVNVLLDAITKDIEESRSVSAGWSLSSLFGRAPQQPSVTSPRPPRIGVVFGTHNWTSVKLILDELAKRGLATVEGLNEHGEPVIRVKPEVAERLNMAQLYGMMDDLTNYIVDRTRSSSPFVLKYVPYGALEEVLPYLGRRAIENKSVLGNGAAVEERRMAAEQIKKRIFG